MKVFVIGSGPAGLMAAEAARSQGCDVTILANADTNGRPLKSVISGAQFLHERIPHLTGYDPDFYVEVVKLGTPEGYAEKVYGDVSAPTSWDKYEHGARLPAWSLREAYDALYKRFRDRMKIWPVLPERIYELAGQGLLINTAPLRNFCQLGHEFKYQSVWVTSQDDEDRLPLGGRSLCEMVYSGGPEEKWYRFSLIEGRCCWEYATNYDFEHMLHKPLTTNCDCYPQMMRAGRHGAWDKNKLSHDAYNETLVRVHEMLTV